MPRLSAEEKRRRAANDARNKARRDRKAVKAAQDAAATADLTPEDLNITVRKAPGHIKQARENLVAAFELIGGVPALVKWGKANLTEFYRIWSRLIPKEAAEEQTNSLEVLLAKLAERGDQPVAIAAYAIGVEKMQAGKEGAEVEDAAALFAQTQGTMQ